MNLLLIKSILFYLLRKIKTKCFRESFKKGTIKKKNTSVKFTKPRENKRQLKEH